MVHGIEHRKFAVLGTGLAPVVEWVDTADLKSAAFLNKERAGSMPARGTR